MPRQLKFDVGDRVHAQIIAVRDKVVDGKVQMEQDTASGALTTVKEPFVSFEADGEVDGIAVNRDDNGPYVDYSIKYEIEGRKGPEIHYKWVREEFASPVGS